MYMTHHCTLLCCLLHKVCWWETQASIGGFWLKYLRCQHIFCWLAGRVTTAFCWTSRLFEQPHPRPSSSPPMIYKMAGYHFLIREKDVQLTLSTRMQNSCLFPNVNRIVFVHLHFCLAFLLVDPYNLHSGTLYVLLVT